MATIQKKVCLLGDFYVGKTSLVRRYVEGRFTDKYLSTIGVKISRKQIDRGTHLLNLLVWDLARAADMDLVSHSYLRGAAGALVVCDLTRPDTFVTMAHYAAQIIKLNQNAALVFAGNKSDLVGDDVPDWHSIVSEYAAPNLLTSAKTGENVEESFLALAAAIERKD